MVPGDKFSSDFNADELPLVVWNLGLQFTSRVVPDKGLGPQQLEVFPNMKQL